MDSILMKANAKINLLIDVINKRDDGYHNVSMIMQTINLHDLVYIQRVKKNSNIKLVCNWQYIACDERNLAYKACLTMKNHFNISDGIFIEIKKSIPVGAGLGGGSADCAAVLLGMWKMFRLPISFQDLLIFSRQFGADVPFCLAKGTCLATGIGQDLKKLRNLPSMHVVVVKPDFSCSTPFIFDKLSEAGITHHPDTEKMVNAILNGDVDAVCDNLFNSFEDVVYKIHPQILTIKNDLIKLGANGALLSGTGSTCFGLYKNKDSASKAYYYLKKIYTNKNVFLTRTYNRLYNNTYKNL